MAHTTNCRALYSAHCKFLRVGCQPRNALLTLSAYLLLIPACQMLLVSDNLCYAQHIGLFALKLCLYARHSLCLWMCFWSSDTCSVNGCFLRWFVSAPHCFCSGSVCSKLRLPLCYCQCRSNGSAAAVKHNFLLIHLLVLLRLTRMYWQAHIFAIKYVLNSRPDLVSRENFVALVCNLSFFHIERAPPALSLRKQLYPAATPISDSFRLCTGIITHFACWCLLFSTA